MKVVDILSFLLFMISFIWDGDNRYWFFLSALILTFVGYNCVSVILLRKLKEEEIGIMTDEILDRKIKEKRNKESENIT